MNYEVVFDVGAAGYRHAWVPAVGVLFVAIALGLLVVSWRWRDRAVAWFALALLIGAGLWTWSAREATRGDYEVLAAALRSGGVAVVEGRVEHFVPMPATGHALEHFCVGSQCFSYSDYVLTAGFNRTASHGGPIREGLRVRVTYLGNQIARLEVAR